MDVLDNRELSWLAFNERVLAESDREDTPLLERLRFAAIFASNMEEFFMVRTGVLIGRQQEDDSALDPRTRLSPSGQLSRIYAEVRRLSERGSIYLSRIENGLAENGVKRVGYAGLDEAQKKIADIFFRETLLPALSVSHTEDSAPFIAGGRLCAVCADDAGGLRFAVCPEDMPRLAALPCAEGTAYILTEDILAARAGEIFGEAADTAVIAVTRSADIHMDELPLGEMPYADAVRQAVNLREALPAVRLRTAGNISEQLRTALKEHFALGDEQVFAESSPLDMRYVSELADALRSRTELFYSPYVPAQLPAGSVIARVLEGDILLSYPYESFDGFLRLLDEAAEDERVTAIKITLYRTAHGSRVAEALCRAARNGKEVTACVELTARFDERHNISCAEKLTAAGCKVIYGLYGVKVHSKLCLITMREGGELMRITQVGTGNYNETTAAQYTDFSLFTADTDIAADAESVFEALCAGRLPDGAYSLMVSPLGLKDRILALLDEEISAADSGASAYFGAKLNGLSDRDIIAKLIEASQHGVRTDLVIRGICCLRPGVPGFTENIRVVSVVGRFLEHARIYISGSGMRQRVYISSADLMTRNTRRRVEAAAPVRDKALRKRLTEYFAAQLNDTLGAWEKHPDGSYDRVVSEGTPVGSQQLFMEENGFGTAEKSEEISVRTAPAEEAPAAEKLSLEKAAAPAAETLPAAADDTPAAEEDIALTDAAEQPSAELPPAPVQPRKQGIFARIAAFFKQLGRK